MYRDVRNCQSSEWKKFVFSKYLIFSIFELLFSLEGCKTRNDLAWRADSINSACQLPVEGIMGIFLSRILTSYKKQSTLNQTITVKMLFVELCGLLDTNRKKIPNFSHGNALQSNIFKWSNYPNLLTNETCEFTNLIVIDNAGKELYACNGVEKTRDLSDDFSFQQALKNDSRYFSNLINGGSARSQGLPFANAIHSRRDLLSGCLGEQQIRVGLNQRLNHFPFLRERVSGRSIWLEWFFILHSLIQRLLFLTQSSQKEFPVIVGFY